MTYWAALILTYTVTSGVTSYEATSTVYFKDMQTCSVASDAIYPVIYAQSRDSMAKCERTDMPSSSIRPVARK
jgi:hypothetical protein|tara:strand:- start:362 stop:580 length:219 start_codon:yes stop_codon:yes gene_type:complete